jgi:hypothetical protein
MNDDFPYKELKKHAVWKVLDRGIKDLQANGDIEARTAREYIVGYLSKVLLEADLSAAFPGQSIPRPVNPLKRP